PFPLGGFDAPGFNRPVFNRQQRVRYDQVKIEVDGAPEPSASFARPQRAIEREQIRDRLFVGDATGGALQLIREWLLDVLGVGKNQRQPSLAVMKGLLQRIVDALLLPGSQYQAID